MASSGISQPQPPLAAPHEEHYLASQPAALSTCLRGRCASTLFRMRHLWIVAGFAASVCPNVGGAQQDGKAAEIFARALADKEAGKLETACPAFDESFRLDPQPGALFAAAQCNAALGKAYAAIQRYRAYILLLPGLGKDQQERHALRLEVAKAAIERLTPSVPRLELVLPTPLPAEFDVRLDGSTLPLESLGRPVQLEAGPHMLETRARNSSVWRLEFAVDPGESQRVQLEVAAPAPAASAPLPIAPADTVAASPKSPAVADVATGDDEAGSLLSARSIGWALGGTGALGVVVGTVAGVSVLRQMGIADDECTDTRECSPRGLKAVEHARDLRMVADVGFGVGIAGLIAGAVLLLNSSSEAEPDQAGRWQPVMNAGADGAWLGFCAPW